METFSLSFDSLRLNREDLFRTLGYAGTLADPYVAEQLERTIARAAQVCRPRAGYLLYRVEGRSERTVSVGGETFAVGRLIASCLEDADCLAVFVATAGQEFADWSAAQARRGDVFREFLTDAVGSEIVEAAARELAQRLALRIESAGMHAGNSYSPGYCGWQVGEQRRLFGLLPERPCGIELNDSCLMSPVKSVSGMIPVGTRVRKMPYGCEICNNPNCYKKRK